MAPPPSSGAAAARRDIVGRVDAEALPADEVARGEVVPAGWHLPVSQAGTTAGEFHWDYNMRWWGDRKQSPGQGGPGG